MSEMVERMAQAYYTAYREAGMNAVPYAVLLPWEEITETHKSFIQAGIVAALESAREPTEIIRDCFDKYVDEAPHWDEVIDAILGKPSP